MCCIIDIQGYQDLKNRLVPKEVVVISDRGLNKYCVKPLKPFSDLTLKEQKVVNWASSAYHRIEYSSGDIKFQDLAYHLYCEGLKYDKIYTKGRDKAIYLCGLLAKPVQDLSEFGAPSVRGYIGPACDLHDTLTAKCAETTARYLWEWIQQQPMVL